MAEQGPLKLFKNRGNNQKINKALLGWSTGLVFLSFIMTAVIFITFPRMGLGFMALNTSSPRITGFSDIVTLGDVGKIKQNSSVVMRVEYTQNGQPYRPKSRILWRGVVLDHYNGKTWNSTLNNGFSLQNKPGKGLSLFQVSRPTEMVEQTVYMESFNIPYLFTHGIPVFIDGNFTKLNMDQGFVLKTDRAQSGLRKIYASL
jgi:protein-glutamine gamma-glutamyltransferase